MKKLRRLHHIIRRETGSNKSYQVRITRTIDGVVTMMAQQNFSDSKCGGTLKAERAAIKWRDKELPKYPENAKGRRKGGKGRKGGGRKGGGRKHRPLGSLVVGTQYKVYVVSGKKVRKRIVSASLKAIADKPPLVSIVVLGRRPIEEAKLEAITLVRKKQRALRKY